MRRGTITVFCALVALSAACSSSRGGGGDGGGDGLSKAEFLKQANAICEAGNQRSNSSENEVLSDSSTEPSAEEIGKYLTESVVPEVRRQLDEIDELKPPSDLQDDVDALLTNARAALTSIEAQAKSDPGSVFSGEDPFADVEREAVKLGLTSCGGGGDDGSSTASS